MDEFDELSIVFFEVGDEAVDGNGIVVLDAAADGVGEEFFGDGAVEILPAFPGESIGVSPFGLIFCLIGWADSYWGQ